MSVHRITGRQDAERRGHLVVHSVGSSWALRKVLLTLNISACMTDHHRCPRLRSFISQQVQEPAMVMSPLNYCKPLLSSLLASAIKPLQLGQNVSAEIVLDLTKCFHVSPLCVPLYRLPAAAHIKTFIIAYKTDKTDAIDPETQPVWDGVWAGQTNRQTSTSCYRGTTITTAIAKTMPLQYIY
ncbi:hypothetical protein Z043_119607 [Scleropages formosus]|uniref:Uncharacterized protein n=1 Tax=Scleropages formosus TaxID=113540 RepID=A0A0P7WMC3_SCLFO|nr:hypothetical protein Z043_119607 [Scleropages formosus]